MQREGRGPLALDGQIMLTGEADKEKDAWLTN
jgi:hypothetical protein